MEPRQVAALLGREIDSGFAAALSDLGASRALVVDRIVARVGPLPEGAESVPDWGDIAWQAEVTLHPLDAAVTGSGADDDDTGTASPDALRARLAGLPTEAIRGVGAAWSRRLTAWGYATVGELAEADPDSLVRRAGTSAHLVLPMLSRARDLTTSWPELPPEMSGLSVAAVARDSAPTPSVAASTLRAHCLRIVAALDIGVAARIVLP